MAERRKKDKNGRAKINKAVPPYKTRSGKISTQKTFYGKTFKEAEQNYKDYIDGKSNAMPSFFDDLIESYITDTFLPDPTLKPRTKQRYIDAYRKNLEPQLWIMHKPVKDLTFKDLQKAYNDMTCKPSGVEACNKLLSRFFQLMLATGFIDRDPLIGVIVPKPQKKNATGEIITFTDDEISKIKAYISKTDLPAYEQKRVDRFRLLILLAMNTGARSSELLALTYDDVTEDGIFINKQVLTRPIFREGKTSGYELVISEPKSDKAVRSVPINADLWQAVQDHKLWHQKEMLKRKYRSEYIFTTSTGKLYDRRSIRHSLDRIHAAAGVSLHGLHTYRRTFASKLAAAGTPLQVLADLLGHDDVNVTAKYYISISTEEKKKAVASLA